MYTGKKDEEAATRPKEKRSDFNAESRRTGKTGGESESFRSQQERIDRADSQRSNLVSVGTTVIGGMLDHLISDYATQVGQKEQEIQRLNDDINRHSEDVKRLNIRIDELKTLRQELKQLKE
ncbi:hypothetical protein [Nostoc sp. 106C]|uniref:hypothetical protein n=1 Tax=Nostoc sp. 106C TaxID=1932667 RepID=UPI001FB5CCE8|nr:hypothetical protein [Nostoc sp. 106C]